MRRPQDVRAEMAGLAKEVEAIINRCTKENRELNKAEQERVDAIQGNGDQRGEMAALDAEYERLVRFEARKTELCNQFASKFGSTSAAKDWKVNADGKKYAILSKNDKLSDYTGTIDCENACGHFILAGVFGQHPSGLTPEPVRNALSTSNGQAGGFLVPDELFGQVWDLARSRIVLLDAGMRVVAMTSSSLNIPRLTQDVTVANKAENAEIPLSNMQFTSHTLVAHTAAARQAISRELWEDAPDLLAAQVENWMIAAMADKVHHWGLNGTGSNQPAGILIDPGISTTDSIGAIDWTDISAALLAVRENNHEPTAAIMSPANLEALQTIDAGNGTDSARAWLMEPASVSGRSLFSTTKCPNSQIIVGDFSHYLMGLRTQPLVEATTVGGDAFKNHQVEVKVTMRMDFVTMDPSAFHILEGVTV